MADIIYGSNTSPYYDTSKKEAEQGYVKFLAVEGKVLQNRELNVMQGLAHENNKRIHDLMIDDGSVISGCSFTNSSEEKVCKLTQGEIYLNGYIITTPSHVWDYAEVPEEASFVYFEVYPQVYDETVDPSLYDPAENYENHGQPGGHRLKFLVLPKIALERDYNSIINIIDNDGNKNTVPVCKLYNRNTYGPVKPKPVFGKLYSYMAQRTYDSLGDFLSEGLAVSAQSNTNNSENFYDVSITPGRAYIKGFDYSYNNTTKIAVKHATDTKSNGGDSIDAAFMLQYYSSTKTYQLGHNFVKQIDSVSGLVESTITDNLSYDNITKTNTLPPQYTPIFSVDEIYDFSGVGNAKVIYNFGSDYTLEDTNRVIVWTSGGSHPDGSFQVKLTSVKNLPSTSYNLVKENNKSYIKFSTSGMQLKDNSLVTIEYTWFLSRIDLVYLTQDGYLKIKTGVSADSENIKKPTIPAGSLPLAYIIVKPGIAAENFNIDSFNIYRVPVSQMQNMKNAISNLEYNFAMTALENLAQNKHLERESMNSLKNIFADAITSYSKIDFGNLEFNATVDVLRSQVTLPLDIDHITIDDVQVIDQNGNLVDISKPITVPLIGSEICEYQPFATHSIDTAPYLFRSMIPKLECSPTQITHVSDTYSTKIIWLPNRIIYSTEYVDNYITKTERTTHDNTNPSLFLSQNTSVDNKFYSGEKISGSALTPNSLNWLNLRGTISYVKSDETVVTDIKTQSSIIGEETVETKKLAFEKIPQPFLYSPSYIKIKGTNFLPNTEIRVYFDDLLILTPEFQDLVFQDTTYTFKGERTVLNTRYLPPTASNPLPDNDNAWNDDIGAVLRPNVWKWEYDSISGYYTITHPSFNGNSLSYRYKVTTKQWQYKYTAGTWINLNESPIWFKWVLRTPWVQDSINSLTDPSKAEILSNLNNYEPITFLEYDTDFSTEKTTIITNGYGDFEALVRLPNNTTVGNHVITCKAIINNDFDNENNLLAHDEIAGETYIRHWVTEVYKRKIQLMKTIIYRDFIKTIVTSTFVEPPRPVQQVESGGQEGGRDGGTGGDPIAQTFRLKEQCFLTGIDLFFEAKSVDLRSNVFFMIKETTDSGFPTGSTLYSTTIPRSSIMVGETYPATHIDFDYPVYIEANKEYSFIVGSTSNGYKILYAKMGNKDLITGQQVLYNANITGVMLESSNSYTWSALQDSDIKYNLYSAVFDTTAQNYYILNANNEGNYTKQNFAMCNTTIPYAVLDDTDVFTKYIINGSNHRTILDTNWYPLKLEEQYIFYPSVEYQAQMTHNIKVTLKTNYYKVTPVIDFKRFESFYGKYKNTGSYIQIPIKLDRNI
jgi:hypothetical protein